MQTPHDDPKPPAPAARGRRPIGILAAAGKSLAIATTTLIACALAWWMADQQAQWLGLWPAAGVAFAFGWRYGALGLCAAAAGAAVWAGLSLASWAGGLATGLMAGVGPAVALALLERLNHWKPSSIGSRRRCA
ncbi:MAG: hypothetical protein R3E83_17420 [Burkholderiaceae bacterium]